MSSPLASLEPALLWQNFDTIRKTPRPSKHEEKIVAEVKKWAAERGFQVLQDEAGSLTIKVPATKGHEKAPTVILQGHLDMVCEKNSDVEHDFMTQGIEVEVVADADLATRRVGDDVHVRAAQRGPVARHQLCPGLAPTHVERGNHNIEARQQ